MNVLFRRRKNVARGLLLSVQLLAAHRLRTALSISALLVGVAAVMLMVAIGRGAEQRLLQRLQGMGTDLVVVSPAPAPRLAGRPRQVAVHTILRADDAVAIVNESASAIASAPAVNRAVVLRAAGLNRSTGLTGTTVEGLRIRNIHAENGRLFDQNDDDERSRVVVLGPKVSRSLFPGIDPVGLDVRIGNLRFEVIGIARPRGIDPLGTDLDDFAIIPFETATRRVFSLPYVHAIYVQAQSSAQLISLEREVREILRTRHAARSGSPEPFLIQNQAMLLRAERASVASINQLIPAVSGIALLLGGVGILTVMLISVKERASEIGLRRALGASRKDIRFQFVLESAMLGTAGGAMGVVVGIVSAAAASFFGDWELLISWNAAMLGFACSLLLGLVIGVIPAARAARLEPIEALRAV